MQKKLRKRSDVCFEIAQSYRDDMRVPARIYVSEKMLDELCDDRTLEQLVNVATLPGIVKAALAMPDAHEGYGFPIGGVAGLDAKTGVISPGGIGYDINCGVRLLASGCMFDDVKNKLESLARELYGRVPSGVGRGGLLKLDVAALDEVLATGVRWMLKEGYAYPEDLEYIESNGLLANADPSLVSDHAKRRGSDQLGTLGAGNHFVEVDVVDELFNEDIAQAYGLSVGQLVVLIHTGSRGLGHQVATDYIRIMMSVMSSYGIELPDRELACVPFTSKEGSNYFNAMAAAANFAWANRQMITSQVRKSWQKELGGDLSVVYDVAHNIAKVETHFVDGEERSLVVHRKGATRAFGPGHDELPERYRPYGQPVLIPGSMGTASYILAGTVAGMEETFGSSCHGAGRRLSRHAVKKKVVGKTLKKELLSAGVIVRAGSISGLAEEAPVAYKNVDDVVSVVHNAGIAQKVARLRPCVVIKG